MHAQRHTRHPRTRMSQEARRQLLVPGRSAGRDRDGRRGVLWSARPVRIEFAKEVPKLEADGDFCLTRGRIDRGLPACCFQRLRGLRILPLVTQLASGEADGQFLTERAWQVQRRN
jgi:hypothetical protein